MPWSRRGERPEWIPSRAATCRGCCVVRAWADIAMEVHAHTEHAGEHNHLLLLRLIDIFRDQIVGGGFMDAPQLARLTGELKEHPSRPETFTLSPLLFLAWGRKPG